MPIHAPGQSPRIGVNAPLTSQEPIPSIRLPEGTLVLDASSLPETQTMADPQRLLSNSRLLSSDIQGRQHQFLDIPKADSVAANALRPSESLGTKPYSGFERSHQALRWFASVAYSGTVGVGEVQATVYDHQIQLTGNRNTNNLLKGALKGLLKANEGQPRAARLLKAFNEHLVDAKGFANFKALALKELDEQPASSRLPEDARQLSSILDTLHHAAIALGSRDKNVIDNFVRFVPSEVYPGNKRSLMEGQPHASMHAEMTLYDDITVDAEAHAAATRAHRGLAEDTPILIPIAGTRRPCGICDHIESELKNPEQTFSVFNENIGPFRLLRASQRPGDVFPGLQALPTHALGNRSEDAMSALLGTMQSRLSALRSPRVGDSYFDTDSEHLSERDSSPSNASEKDEDN
ncbi:hypothetical protein ACKC9G_08505 [Pokkaliibacter sp. CJK22405]|uniref:hypothetical protein n=1 Tax=Pokkaliibacter sp. CJK22405 TaxID=3384615 RepID=UPI0039846F40